MTEPVFTVTRITDGLAFGEGSISGLGEPEILKLVDDTIHNSPDILIPVDRDDAGNMIGDDGCGDGRGVAKIFSKDKEFKRSLHRPKVFGGAPTMGMAERIGLGHARGHDLETVFKLSVDNLIDQGLSFGGHVDCHANHERCGCGAIDRAPDALVAALKYEDQIRATIGVLGVDEEGIDEVYQNFRDYVREDLARMDSYRGRAVMEMILESANRPVIKELDDEHKELRIVLNQIENTTVNQALVREATNGQAQIFAVDVWRLEEIASRLYPSQPESQHKTILSELIYTLAISAVLTDGKLPVDMIQRQTEEANLAVLV